MKTKKCGILALLAVLVIGIVLTSGCIEEQKEKPGEKPDKAINEIRGETPGETKAPSETPNNKTPTEQPTETLSEILGRGAGISSVKYDMVTTMQGMPPMTQKIWLKKNKMRTETTMEGETMVHLIDMDAKTMYMYIPAQNIAMKIDFGKAPKPPIESIESNESTEKYIEKYKPVIVGTEIVDGKVCIVYEAIIEGVKTKSWVWKEKGFLVRTEVMTPEGKMITEYKNIEFVDIPDGMFELPAGVEIIEMPTML